jgi:hypothetical protein
MPLLVSFRSSKAVQCWKRMIHMGDEYKLTMESRRNWLLVFLGALPVLVALLMVYAFSYPMKNNGDYYRVTESTTRIQDLVERVECFRPGDYSATPKSTMAFIYRLIIRGGYAMGIPCVNQNSVFGALALLYFFGVLLCVMGAGNPVVSGLFWAAWAILFATYFSSLFEEAATFALIPWVFGAYVRSVKNRKLLGFTIVAAFFVYTKSQMIYFVPLFLVLLWPYKELFGVVRMLCSVAAIAALGFCGGLQKSENMIPNSYNRMFNGLGWSMQGVSSWPVREFAGRLGYFQSHRHELQSLTQAYEPMLAHPLMGSSYWPDGEQAVNGKDPVRKASILLAISPENYLGTLFFNKTPLLDFVKSGVSVLLISDYATQYLFDREGRSPPLLHDLRSLILSYAGWSIAIVLVFLWSRNSLGLGVVFLLFAMPYFVVLGDGYYEFEKHMLTYLMALPLFGLAGVVKVRPAPDL